MDKVLVFKGTEVTTKYVTGVGNHTIDFTLSKFEILMVTEALARTNLKDTAKIVVERDLDMDSLLVAGQYALEKFEHLNQLINGKRITESISGDGQDYQESAGRKSRRPEANERRSHYVRPYGKKFNPRECNYVRAFASSWSHGRPNPYGIRVLLCQRGRRKY